MSSPSRLGLAALLYALLIAYASTIVGPLGVNFTPIAPSEALTRLLSIAYVQHGSDQRSDWMGNVALLVPLSCLLAGFLCGGGRLRPAAGIAALLLCLVFVVAVKYLQLFFPPRTVTLNYVLAQAVGSAAGVSLYGILREAFAETGKNLDRLEGLLLGLRIYSVLLVLFLLTPLDFALNAEDLQAQLARARDSFTAFNGEGRPFFVQLTVLLAGILALAPVGALLTLVEDGRVHVGRSIGTATFTGFCAMMAVHALTLLIISGAPSLPGVFFRTIGIALGAWAMHALTRQRPDAIRHALAECVPWVVPVYVAGILAVNGLLSFNWSAPADLPPQWGERNLIPLFNYYIVSKAQAVKNIAAHAVMYAPIGAMLWLRGGGRAAAFWLAALLSLIVETGRWFHPALVPDINAIPLAGIAAWATAALMPLVWRMLSTAAIGLAPAASPSALPEGGAASHARNAVPGWRERAAERQARRRNRGQAIGDVEDY